MNRNTKSNLAIALGILTPMLASRSDGSRSRFSPNLDNVVYKTSKNWFTYFITVDDKSDATYVALWKQKSGPFETTKRVGELDFSKVENLKTGDKYLKVEDAFINKVDRHLGFGKKMYQIAMEYSHPTITSIRSYLPDRLNKKQIPSIYKSLGGYEDEDWSIIPITRVRWSYE
jgi:hypothetical protein